MTWLSLFERLFQVPHQKLLSFLQLRPPFFATRRSAALAFLEAMGKPNGPELREKEKNGCLAVVIVFLFKGFLKIFK